MRFREEALKKAEAEPTQKISILDVLREDERRRDEERREFFEFRSEDEERRSGEDRRFDDRRGKMLTDEEFGQAIDSISRGYLQGIRGRL